MTAVAWAPSPTVRNQHQIHRPAAKPVLGLRRRPGRQRKFVAVEAAHPRAMHGHLAPMEANLALGSAPAVADPAPTTAMRRAGGRPCPHQLNRSAARLVMNWPRRPSHN